MRKCNINTEKFSQAEIDRCIPIPILLSVQKLLAGHFFRNGLGKLFQLVGRFILICPEHHIVIDGEHRCFKVNN